MSTILAVTGASPLVSHCQITSLLKLSLYNDEHAVEVSYSDLIMWRRPGYLIDRIGITKKRWGLGM